MDLFKFPFHADVWGSASEWVMILVTLLTAILLYKTLKSQNEVQQAQNKLLEIEQTRLRQQFRPDIQYHDFSDSIGDKHRPKLKKTSELVSVAVKNHSENAAIDYDFPRFNNPQVEVAETFHSQPSLVKGTEYASIYFIIKNIGTKNKATYNFTFFFTYHDLIGTKYIQRVLCQKENGQLTIRSHIPEIAKG